MKDQNKYRFTLQFPANTQDNIRAGKFLERMGNKKSGLVVHALCRLLDEKPELESSNCKVSFEKALSHEDIEKMIREAMDKMQIGETASVPTSALSAAHGQQRNPAVETVATDLDAALDFIDNVT